jgi:hypothetical protein
MKNSMQKFCFILLTSFNGVYAAHQEPAKKVWQPAHHYGEFTLVSYGGYSWLSNEKKLFKGKRDNVSIRTLDRGIIGADEKDINDLKKTLAGQYKIHLMPKDEDMDTIITILVNAIKNDKELQNLISDIKIHNDISHDISRAARNEPVFARIVIYPSDGKKNAQKLLNKLYTLFKGKEGLNITPRFNAKLTSLIYVSQGDADYKLEAKYDKYYELPSKVYYNKTYLLPNEGTEHYLKHPKRNEWIR